MVQLGATSPTNPPPQQHVESVKIWSRVLCRTFCVISVRCSSRNLVAVTLVNSNLQFVKVSLFLFSALFLLKTKDICDGKLLLQLTQDQRRLSQLTKCNILCWTCVRRSFLSTLDQIEQYLQLYFRSVCGHYILQNIIRITIDSRILLSFRFCFSEHNDGRRIRQYPEQ
jgi:hypothetical protein